MNAQSVGWAIVFTGSAVVSLSAVLASALPQVFNRLHLLTVTTSLGAPIIGVGLMILRGWTEASAMIAAITVLVALSAPVISAATARLAAQLENLLDKDAPS
ncbi:monovalent cation/H(+) antiporter subunit G [Mycobacterium heidelbergense]|uniref:monovalent cation/H(+) antiporter subunit G n=1 Tax=Mycobacterium heidelbergense TaxID=53376 RepID=UPI003CF97163